MTSYNGQKELIEDVIKQRCSWNPLFGVPSKVSTVDKYQGQSNDYILLSLVRTKTVGHIRDVRRLVVALSRARLGLIVFGRMSVFKSSKELKRAFDLFPTEDSLMLVSGEVYGQGIPNEQVGDQVIADEAGKKRKTKKTAAPLKRSGYKAEGVEFMGKQVNLMTQEKIEELKRQQHRI